MLVFAAGCTSVPKDLGRSDVDLLVSDHGRPTDSIPEASPAALIDLLTSDPLTAESAVRLALINNPELKAAYAELGVAAADVYKAGRIRNPVLSLAFLDSNVAGDLDQNTFGLVTSFTDLVTLSARKRLAAADFAAVKKEIGAAVLDTAARAETAYYDYVSAKQVAALRAQIAKAGVLSRDLATRYHAAGNLTPRNLALERAAASAATIDALDANAKVVAQRKALAEALGLSVGGTWDAPAQVAGVPAIEIDLADLIAQARTRRLDLAAARARADAVAKHLGVTSWTRWLGDLEAGAETERETDGSRITGPTASWSIPIFSQNRDQLLRIDARLRVAVADVARLTIGVENDVRLAHAAMMNARARAEEYRDRLIPARAAAVARAQEEQNFMLIGIFEVIAAKQQEYDAYQGYLEAVRDYWRARVELTRSVGDMLPGGGAAGAGVLDVNDYTKPAEDDGHMGHDGTNHGATKDDAAPMDHSGHDMKKGASPPDPVNADEMPMDHQMEHGGMKMDPAPAAGHEGHIMKESPVNQSPSGAGDPHQDHGADHAAEVDDQ
jgi:cobalt-zinc-cadmium efflux system outer membrane protein